MSSFESLYRGCEHKFNFKAKGTHDESWEIQIGIRDQVQLNGDREDAIQLVAQDCFKHLRAEPRNAQVVIVDIEEKRVDEDTTRNVIHYKLFYQGKVEEHHTDEPVITIQSLVPTNDHRVLLERFSQYDESEMTAWARFKRALVDFFTELFEPYESLSLLWEALTGRSKKEMQYDLNLLAEVCGTPVPNSLSMTKSLKYMVRLLNREQKGIEDPNIAQRLKNCLVQAKMIKRLRKKFNPSDFNKLIKKIQKNIDQLPDDGKDKLLIPVGYHHDGELVEMFLEVKKTGTDTCTVSLISQSAETLDLFDREVGVETTTSSFRREIANVNIAELKGRVPLFAELQVNPDLEKIEGVHTRDAFLFALQFAGASVSVGIVTEKSFREASFGHVAEMMSYVREELFDTTGGRENAERFEVAARLRFFLDFCKKDKRWLRDESTRELVRTTAFRLMEIVESNRNELIGEKLDEQSRELEKIVLELEQLMASFDKVLPFTVDLRARNLGKSKLGSIGAIASEETPVLENVSLFASPLKDVDPPLTPFDADNPVKCLEGYAKRCQALLDQGEIQRAHYEAHQMVRSLPPLADIEDDNWMDPEVLNHFEMIGKAIVKGSLEKKRPSLEDAMTASMLSVYAYKIAYIQEGVRVPGFLILQAQRTLMDLSRSRLPMKDKKIIHDLLSYSSKISTESIFDSQQFKQLPIGIAHSLVNINEFAAIASMPSIPEEMRENLANVNNFRFSIDIGKNEVRGHSWKRNIRAIDHRLTRHFPDYASHVAEELGNRYVTELCPYGCSTDNCRNYGGYDSSIARQGHQYYPPYMLYHYTQEYCPEIYGDAILNPDEIRDLLLIQQTNRPADILYGDHHSCKGDRLGNQFEKADGFTKDDRRIQVMSAFSIFMRHPNFFKIPELRWYFETKILTGNYFSLLLKQDAIDEHLPFLLGSIKGLQQQIQIAEVNQDMATGAYLVYILGHLSEMVEFSDLNEEVKEPLLQAAKIDCNTTIIQWLIDSAGRTGEKAERKQKELLPYVLHYYLSIYRENPESPLFQEDKHLEILAFALGKYNEISRLSSDVDPILVEGYHSLKVAILPKLKDRILNEPEGAKFINQIVNRVQPEVAELDLDWDAAEFPLCVATDGNTSRVYQFDINTGKIYIEGERVEVLPAEIAKIPEVALLFSEKLEEVWKVEGALPDLSPEATRRERVTAYLHEHYPGQRITVTQKVDAQGHPTGEKPIIRVERDVNFGSRSSKWAVYHRFGAQDLLAHGLPIGDSDLPLKVVAAIGNRSCWLSSKGDEIYVFDLDDDKLYATVSLDLDKKDADSGQAPIKEFIFTGSRRLVSPDDRDLENYSAVEEESFIMVTGHKGRPRSLEYPRLQFASNGAKLTYSLTNKGDVTPNYPGYYLAPLGYRPGNRFPSDDVYPLPETFDHFQTLRRDGAEVVLIPGRKLQQLYSKTGERLPKCSSIPPDGIAPSVLFEYEVDIETNRLKAKNGDAYAYLAYVAMAHQDYSGAKFYLSKAHQATGYSEEYLKIFDWITSWKDESDNCKAVKLYAAHFQEKVIDELKQDNIRRGKMNVEVESRESRMKRLAVMTDLYQTYRQSIQGREIGLTGFDPMLDLSPDAEAKVLALCYEFVDACRDNELAPSGGGSATFARAESAQTQFAVSEPSGDKQLDLYNDALLLWAFTGSSTNIPTLTYGCSEWVLDCFGHVYQQILELDPASAEYQELLQKIRFLSINSLSKRKLTAEEKATIKVAQSYLLRLAAKKESGNSGELSKTFPKVGDPFFGKSRRTRLIQFTTLPLENIGKPTKELEKLVDESNPPWLNVVIKKMIEFSDNYTGSDFKEDSRIHFLNVIFGTSNKQDIDSINGIVDMLKDQELISHMGTIDQREEIELEERAPVTVLEQYRDLFENPPEYLSSVIKSIDGGGFQQRRTESSQTAEIHRLENRLKSLSDSEPRVRPAEIDKGFHAVLGDHLVDKYRSYYTTVQADTSPVDEGVFDELDRRENKAVKRLAAEHRSDMQAYHDDRKQVSMTKAQAKKLRSDLVSQKEAVVERRRALRDQLMDTVDHFDTPAGILAMRRMTGKANKPTLNYLINLWRDGELTLDWEHNPLNRMGVNEISPQDLQVLDQTITEYMEITTTDQHIDRVIHATDIYLESCGKKSKSTGDQQLAQTLVKLVETRRFYTFFVPGRKVTATDMAIGMQNEKFREHILAKLKEKHQTFAAQVEQLDPSTQMDVIISHFSNNNALIQKLLSEDPSFVKQLLLEGNDEDFRDLLFEEYRMGIVMWKPQVDTYRGMLHDPDKVKQLGMGWGKSKTLLPLLAKRKATGKNLVMLMLPDALYETNCRDLEATNRELFGQGIFRFDFNRQSDRSVIALQQTYINLLRTIQDKGFVTTTKNSMLSFRNAYFELLHQLDSIPEESREGASEQIKEINDKLRVMSKILILFAHNTEVLADEVDACLDVRKEVNFALGTDEKVDPIIHDAGIELMEIIIGAEQGTDLDELRVAILTNTNASISPMRRKELMGILAGNFYDRNSVEGIERDPFIHYFLNTSGEKELPEFMQKLKVENPPLYKKFAAAKAFLHQGYGSTLGKVANVNYGRDPVSGIWTIPYKASNTPNIGSEYDDTIERVSYTIQDYIQNGVSFEQVFNVVALMRKSALEEIQHSPKPMSQTRAAAEFKRFMQQVDPERKFGDHPSLDSFDTNRKVRSLQGVINEHPMGKLLFLRGHVLDKMTQSPLRVNAVSDDVVAMVAHFGGFSGTIGNRHTFNDRIEAEKTLGTDGRTWSLLLRRDVKVKTFDYDSKDSIGSLLEGGDIVGNYQATIDTGAYLRGTSNQAYINRYLEKAGEEDVAGIYFDQSGKIVKKVGEDGRAVPIDQAASTDFMKTHTLYDQSHTVGADIKQGRKARALVTVGENTFITDLFQAVWRMRQLNEEQEVDILVSEAVKKMILAGGPDRDITIKDILIFCLSNEAHKEADDNFRAEKGKIQGFAIQVILTQLAIMIANDQTEDVSIYEVAKALGFTFTKKRPKDEAFDEYARPRVDESPDVLLKDARSSAASRIESMTAALDGVIDEDVDHPLVGMKTALKEKKGEIEDRKNPDPSLMPDKVDRAALESGQQVELEAQIELQLETMAEVDQQQETETQVQTEHVIEAGIPVDSGAGGEINPVTSEDIVNIHRIQYARDLRHLSRAVAAFDTGIFVSSGLERQIVRSDYSDDYGSDSQQFARVARTMFYTYRKAVTDVLISKDETGKWYMIIPTIHEAQAGCREFVQSTRNQAAVVTVGGITPVVKFKTGVDRSEELPFQGEDRRHFFRLYVQAKFFNGEINYSSEEEIDALKEWLKEKDAAACRRLFERHILPTKPTRFQDEYPLSPLARVFADLIQD